jgi:hypothetical protein
MHYEKDGSINIKGFRFINYKPEKQTYIVVLDKFSNMYQLGYIEKLNYVTSSILCVRLENQYQYIKFYAHVDDAEYYMFDSLITARKKFDLLRTLT